MNTAQTLWLLCVPNRFQRTSLHSSFVTLGLHFSFVLIPRVYGCKSSWPLAQWGLQYELFVAWPSFCLLPCFLSPRNNSKATIPTGSSLNTLGFKKAVFVKVITWKTSDIQLSTGLLQLQYICRSIWGCNRDEYWDPHAIYHYVRLSVSKLGETTSDSMAKPINW